MRDRQRDILEQMRAMVAELDGGGELTYVSASVEDILGYAPEELVGRRSFDWIHEEDVRDLRERFAEALSSGQPARALLRARHKSGHFVWLEATGRTQRGPDGAARIVALTRDASELVRAGEALRESEDRFRALAEHASDLILELDPDGRYLYVNPGCAALLGVPPEALLGRSMFLAPVADRIHPEDRERVLRGFAALVKAGGGGGSAEYRYRHDDGSWRWFESCSRTYRARDSSLRVVVVAREVTRRRRAEQELRESEERYRVLTEATSDLITELDAEGRLLFASPTLKDVLGYAPEEMVGTTPLTLVLHPDDLESSVRTFLESIETARPSRSAPYRMRHRNGRWRWFESTGVPYRRADGELRMLAVTRDVSERIRAEEERRALEARMQHTQKLEGLGAMAGGIAHDFNNLLTPILGDSSLLLMDLPGDSPLRERIERIRHAAHRAAALTNQMLAYSGKRPLVAEPVSLSRLVLELTPLLESSVSSKAVLSFDLAADVPLVDGDVPQLSQVVMNVVTNASEAIGRGAGRIEIRTGSVTAFSSVHRASLFGAELREGPCVYLEVRDTGCGMGPETRSRIFDPFFTTKFTGRGLGLAAALGIVRSHGGAIEIESEPDRGTRLRVILPSAQTAPGTADAGIRPERRSRGSVLVVDDEEGVRELARETLERSGLAVVCAGDRAEALRAFRERPEIDLVVLDCTLPRSSGEEIFDALRGIRAEVPILLMSGYREEATAARFAGRGVAGFVHKPFLPEDLVLRVQAALRG